MATTPPPTKFHPDDLPDYYLGKLLYFDADGDDNCRYVVYDGLTKVRCPTRSAALHYIETTQLGTDDERSRLLLDARLHLAAAMDRLDRAARRSQPPLRQLLDLLAVKVKPLLVEIDNQLLL